MSSPLLALRERAKAARHPIVLSEGVDARVLEAAGRAVADGLAQITVLAPEGTPVPDGVLLEDPATSPHRAAMIEGFLEARAKKNPTRAQAEEAVSDPLVWAALMVRMDRAGGTIGGAINTTSNTVRAALQMIGTAKGAPLVSSFCLMVLPEDHPTRPGASLVYADCGLVIDPSAEEMAAIGVQSAGSARALLGLDPKVAMLSFSTKGSAQHEAAFKVAQATEIAQKKSDFAIDGEMQFDAAFDEAVGASKAPGSPVAGQATVFVFPSLEAGNIAYKITQRIGGAMAIGPVLQGLAKPANDLSRGCSADDIYEMIAVTSAQIDALEQ